MVFLFRGQFARIAALAARIHAGLDECRAQRQRLLLGFRAHVIAFDDGAQTMGGGDRLQTRDAEAHHQHFGRPDRAGGRGDLRQDAGEMGRAELHGVVSRQGGLARQRVHRLRPRDARHTFHGEAGDLLLEQALHQRRLLVRIDEGDEDRAFLHRVDHVQRGRLHGEDHIGVADQLLAIIDEGDVLERGVGQLDGVARARLHVQLRAQLDQLGATEGTSATRRSCGWVSFRTATLTYIGAPVADRSWSGISATDERIPSEWNSSSRLSRLRVPYSGASAAT